MFCLNLESPDGITQLGPDCLVFAIDDTGHEAFADKSHPVFGLGGCGFLVRDYQRFIETPWNCMCNEFFPEEIRPMHASKLKNLTDCQKDALGHFFENFMFLRVAALMALSTENEDEVDVIQVVGAALLQRIIEVAKWTPFNRLYVLVEESQRNGNQIMHSLSNRKIDRDGQEIDVELGAIPKAAVTPALEVADFIIQAAGGQARRPIEQAQRHRKDFELVFRGIDQRLTSYLQITRVVDNGAA